jgi:hypothetical protein
MSGLENMVIDITPSDTINLNMSSDPMINNKPSVNFGGGIELLMNEKKKTSSAEIGLGELSDLENELNDLSTDINKKSLENSRSSLFNTAINSISASKDTKTIDTGKSGSSNVPNVTFAENSSNLGEATANAYSNSKSWDGYGKFNNVPVESNEEAMSKEELLREKFKYLRRLEDLEKKGASLTKKYTMESPLSELQGEYEMIISEKEKSNSVKFQGRMLMAAITGIEFLNSKFDPFDLKMDGWAEQVNENVSDYDEIFGELHEKYKSKAKMAPELKLLFQLGGSAIMVHMTNTMFKSTMPGMDDIMKQNPELMQQFTQAAVNSMGNNNPGFGNFMNDFMPNGQQQAPPPTNMGSPPPPVNTQSHQSQRYAPPQNRPDLMASRTQEGISIQEKFTPLDRAGESINTQSDKRPEMKGPGDISDILSRLKTKETSTQQQQQQQQKQQQQQQQQQQEQPSEKNPSTISIQDLKELSNQKLPKSNRKPKSNSSKNTISLDL